MESAVTKKTPPKRVQYNFYRLKERGDFFFVPGDDESLSHRVRQAALSYTKHHPELKKSGDRLRVYKEMAENVEGVKDGTRGVGVYRVAING